MLLVRLFGGASIESDDGPLTGAAVQRHRLALLSLLCASHPFGVRRAKLLGYLWPERPPDRARNLLNQAAYALRRGLGRDAVLSAGGELRIDPTGWRCDVVTFGEALREGDPRRAVEVYRGPFLDGFFLPGSRAFAEWVEEKRESFRGSYVRALERLAAEAHDSDDPIAAAALWRRRLALDPHSGRLVLRLMECLGEAGDRAAAIREAEEYEARMTELSGLPEPEVSAFADRLRRTAVEAGRGTGPRAATAEHDRHPMIGRQGELRRLREAWRAASRGPRLALIDGEPGIGKSHLAAALLTWARARGAVTASTRSYAAEGRLPYAPVADWLRSGAIFPGLTELEPGCLAELARLLPELRATRSDIPPPRPLTERWQRQTLFAALARAVLARGGPTMLLIDDLQWTDPDTVQWLHYLLRYDEGASLLVVGTARTDETSEDHPLRTLLHELRRRERATEVSLGPLTKEDTTALASRMIGREMDADAAEVFFQHTEGHPLFIVETVRATMSAADAASRTQSSARGQWALGEASLTPRVKAVIRSRLSRLSAPARELATIAAAMGRTFEPEVLRRASGTDAASVTSSLDELWRHGIIREGADHTYDFTHDRLREVAYAELTPVRRRGIHASIAQALRAVHTDEVDRVQGELAHHHEVAGDVIRAAEAYQAAGEGAQRMYANGEAIGHFTRALTLLDRLPDDARRSRRELAVQWGLAVSLIARDGWGAPEVKNALSRVRTLGEIHGDTARLAQAFWGLHAFHLVRAELTATLELGERLLALGKRERDPAALTTGHNGLGFTRLFLGEHPAALEHLDQGAAQFEAARLRTPRRHVRREVGVLSPAMAAHALWHLGYPDAAMERNRQALAMADAESNPYCVAIALAYAAMLHQLRREPHEAEVQASAAVDVSEEHGFAYYRAWGTMLRGWAVAHLGRCAEGLEELGRGLDDLLATGSSLRYPYYLGLLGEAESLAGHRVEAAAHIDRALDLTYAGEERWHVPQLLILRSALSALVSETEGDPREGELLAERALRMARQQSARMLEIRAAVRLCRLRRGSSEAANTLQAAYATITEGFETPDLVDARNELERIRGQT